jgi:hypothetical protein
VHDVFRRNAMPVDVSGTLRQALARLMGEKARIERQAAALQDALRAVNGAGISRPSTDSRVATRRAKRRSRRMSPAAREAVSARMKAYWAKRKGRASKGKRKKA